MRKTTKASIYGGFCTLLLVASAFAVAYFAWQGGTDSLLDVVISFAVSLFLAPVMHELGHITFADAMKMQVVYAKFFCFKIQVKNKKVGLYFASPFASDETQAIPKKGGDMQKRAVWFTLGGLIYSGVMLAIVLACAITLSCLGYFKGQLWGFIPYASYLFLMNVLPLEYPNGKTDMLVYKGIKKGYDAEKNMLAAMEIQGRLYAGESYAEIDETLYYNVPQLSEDEPLFAVLLDLRYRYHLEKGEMEKAAACLNRLALLQVYLPQNEVEKIAGELVYLHAINGDLERAEVCGKACATYLASETLSAKRILAAFSSVFGKVEAVEPLKKQAQSLLDKELVKGNAKFEEILLSRIPLGKSE